MTQRYSLVCRLKRTLEYTRPIVFVFTFSELRPIGKEEWWKMGSGVSTTGWVDEKKIYVLYSNL